MKPLWTAFLSLCVCLNLYAQVPAIEKTQPETARIAADLQAALVNRVEVAKNSVGIVVGILTPDGRRYIT